MPTKSISIQSSLLACQTRRQVNYFEIILSTDKLNSFELSAEQCVSVQNSE